MIAAVDDWEQAIKLLRLLSMEMLELAQAGGWDEAIIWEGKRRTLLDELFQRTPPADLVPLLAETVRAVLASDAQLKELARAEMDKLSNYLKSFRQGRHACAVYRSL